MKSIRASISMNAEEFGYPWIIIEKDGVEVYSAKGNSLLSNWILQMYGQFNYNFLPDGLAKVIFNSGTGTSPDYIMHDEYGKSVEVAITRVEEPAASGFYRVSVIGDNSPYWNSYAIGDGSMPVQMMGIGNGTAFGENVNGRWVLVEKSPGTSGDYWLADPDSGPSWTYPDLLSTGNIDLSKCTPYARIIPAANLISEGNPDLIPSYNNMGFGQIELGYDGVANVIDQRFLNHEIPEESGSKAFTLSHGSLTISAPVVGATTSTLEVQQTFTNAFGSTPTNDILINEIGYYGLVGEGHLNFGYHALLSRDVVAPTTIDGGGGQITIRYQFITATPITGGILANWNELLYRKFADLDRAIFNVDNDNVSEAAGLTDFNISSGGGDGELTNTTSDIPGEWVGPQVGHSTKDVVNTDFRLQYEAGDTVYDGSTAIEGQDSRYANGVGAFQLLIYGALLENMQIDIVNDKAGFDVVRIFHNENGSSYRKVLTVTGSSGDLVVKIDTVDYTEAYATSADATAAAWVATHAATLLALGNSIVVTDTGVAEITMVAEREFVTLDASTGTMAFSKVETRDDLVINEVGLYCGRNLGGEVITAVCVMKKQLATINLSHDEYIKVILTFEVSV